MDSLTGTAKTIFDEIFDEIDEEIKEALDPYFKENVLENLINSIQKDVKEEIIEVIKKHYSEDMKAVHKLILGEKASRIVTFKAKEYIQTLVGDVLKHSFDVIDELRNEIIGEVFEETE